ncbi:transglycosylase SLT domain-containing protein [Solilutibacter silvestris]
MLAIALVMSLVTTTAVAADRKDPMAEWKGRMTGLDTRIKAAQSEAELHELQGQMDQLLQACAQARGCDIAQLLPIYRAASAARSNPVSMKDDNDDGGDGPDEMIDVAGDKTPQQATADALLDERNRHFLDMVKMNPAVQAGIRRWLTDMRPSLMASYENFQYLKSSMLPAFQSRGLSEALLFGIIAKESNGKVHVGSRVGAVGPLQFMPATGRRFGLGQDGSGFDTRYDPKMSSAAAAEYFSERYAELNNNIELSLAAYNGGEGRALRVYQASGGRSFWDADVYAQFPAETRDYVPMVIAAAWLYLHPREYGVRFPRVSDRPAQIKLEKPTSFNEMTICMGNARGTDGYLRALRNMNPRYSPDTWLSAGTVLNATTAMSRAYSWNCTSGRRAELAHELMTADARSALVRIGPLEPGATSAASAQIEQAGIGAATQDPATRIQPLAVAAPPPKAIAKPAPRVEKKEKPKRVKQYRVAKGDTLGRIADKHDCDLKALAKANGLHAPGYVVKPGSSIKLEGCDN